MFIRASYASDQELTFIVKSLRKDFHKESQPALKRYLGKQLQALDLQLTKLRKHESGFKPLRTPWERISGAKFDDCHQ